MIYVAQNLKELKSPGNPQCCPRSVWKAKEVAAILSCLLSLFSNPTWSSEQYGNTSTFLKSHSCRSDTVHPPELCRELLVGHWYAKLTFNCLQTFQDHLNCNSTGKGIWTCEIKSLWAWFMKMLQTIYIGKECMKILYSVPVWFIKFLFPV